MHVTFLLSQSLTFVSGLGVDSVSHPESTGYRATLFMLDPTELSNSLANDEYIHPLTWDYSSAA